MGAHCPLCLSLARLAVWGAVIPAIGQAPCLSYPQQFICVGCCVCFWSWPRHFVVAGQWAPGCCALVGGLAGYYLHHWLVSLSVRAAILRGSFVLVGWRLAGCRACPALVVLVPASVVALPPPIGRAHCLECLFSRVCWESEINYDFAFMRSLKYLFQDIPDHPTLIPLEQKKILSTLKIRLKA